MEYAVLAQEVISHSTMDRKDLYMVQIDFSNASSWVPHDLIHSVMTAMCLPTTCLQLVKNAYTDNGSEITLTGWDTSFVQWQSDAVQVGPLSATLLNICLESFLRRIEEPGMPKFGYGIKGMVAKVSRLM
jgi:hypothetical protein